MLLKLLYLGCIGTVVTAAATPWSAEARTKTDITKTSIQRRQELQEATLPMNDADRAERAREIETTRSGFLYGPSRLGNTSFYPAGPLGNAVVQADVEGGRVDAAAILKAVREDLAAVNKTMREKGGIKTIADYALLYDGQWKKAAPDGVLPGMLSNYTSDLLFSMERLSVNPYILRRAKREDPRLPFKVDDATVQKVTKTKATFASLLSSGSLFYVDHSYQKAYERVETRYTAYCSALFYIHPISRDFLPLAIKTNIGSDLVYTPLDSPDDWLLAKIMFNVNDFFWSQFVHVGNTHAVGEIAYQACGDTNPKHQSPGPCCSGSKYLPSHILSIGPADKDAVMFQVFSIRTIGELALFAPGGLIDRNFAISRIGATALSDGFYLRGEGSFQGKYFERDLAARGLLECKNGTQLKSFPYYEDTKVIHSEIREFMKTLVQTYYPSDKVLAQDHELQAWIREATAEAKVIDFPAAPLKEASTLVDILTHLAYLGGVKHHVLNTAMPFSAGAVLPFHPMALYQPPPAAKNVTNIIRYLPPLDQALSHLNLVANFQRDSLESQNRTLVYMFSDEKMLDRLDERLRVAESKFKSKMQAFSQKIRSRRFDQNGLSQGAPFIYRVVDPGAIPFFFGV